jgi:hypothetical protein
MTIFLFPPRKKEKQNKNEGKNGHKHKEISTIQQQLCQTSLPVQYE